MAKRRQKGTTLVEILVVIVIFLIGILAVVQVFPRGFQLLLTTRNNSVATALGREAVERLKGSPELIPDEVVPVVYVNGSPMVDPTVNPLSLSPQGDSLDASGVLTRGSYPVAKDWKLASGPNVARRILGEGHRIPAVREVYRVSDSDATQNYGAPLVLDHNPVDPGPDTANPNIVAYGNEMSRTEGAPLETVLHNANVSADANGSYVQAVLPNNTTVNLSGASTYTTPVSTAPFEFFTVSSISRGDSATPPGILLPALATANRTYRIRLSAYINNGSGGARRVDFTSLSVFVPRMNASSTTTPPTVPPQLVYVPIAEVLKADSLITNLGDLYSVEPESVRVAPQFRRVSTWSTAGTQNLDMTLYPSRNTPIDPFEMRVLDPNLGVLLFSPATRNGVVSRPGGVSEPLLARVDYDVLDWRVVSEDFRLTKNDATVLLSLQSLKVGGNLGPDGLSNGGIFNGALQGSNGNAGPWDPSISPGVPGSPRDNVIVIDLATGCEVQKYRTDNTDTVLSQVAADDPTGVDSTKVLVGVDKSRGSITFHSADTNSSNPLSVRLLVPKAGATPIVVPAANRTFRVLYRARQEWAVQTLKGASQYTLVNSLPSGSAFLPDTAFLGDGATSGTSKFRVYFPASQAGSKVTIDRIAYNVGNAEGVLEGQDFVLRTGNDSTSYAYADLSEVIPNTTNDLRFSTLYGSAPVQGIKGASVSVRVLWNPDVLSLTNDTATNFARIDQYNRGWRKSTSQTYLRAEETR